VSFGHFGTQVGGRHAGAFICRSNASCEPKRSSSAFICKSVLWTRWICLPPCLLQQKLDLDELAEQLPSIWVNCPGEMVWPRAQRGLNPHYRLVQFTAFDFKPLPWQ